jgi:hypothetical protein
VAHPRVDPTEHHMAHVFPAACQEAVLDIVDVFARREDAVRPGAHRRATTTTGANWGGRHRFESTRSLKSLRRDQTQ